MALSCLDERLSLCHSVLSVATDELDFVCKVGTGEGIRCISGLVQSKWEGDGGCTLGKGAASMDTTDANSSNSFGPSSTYSLSKSASSSASISTSSSFPSALTIGIMSSTSTKKGSLIGMTDPDCPACPALCCCAAN